MASDSCRPRDYHGRGDKYLTPVAAELRRFIAKRQNQFRDRSLILNSENLRYLSLCLVEFAEDIHNEIGIWQAVEDYNEQFFGNRLPFVNHSGGAVDGSGITVPRTYSFIWNLYPQIMGDGTLHPGHPDLSMLAEAIAGFLAERFKSMPRDSGIKRFLKSPNDAAWQVKKKLVWLGTRSYLFRHEFADSVEDPKQGTIIATIDDFVCQECTTWSGLGVIDILAACLELADTERAALRTWHERHLAWYRIVQMTSTTVEAINIINDEPYVIANGESKLPFKVNQLVFASLVPWKQEWYWSGQQQILNDCSDKMAAELRSESLKALGQIIFRYSKPRLLKAREQVNEYYQEFIRNHGSDLIHFPDGLSMAAALQRDGRRKWDALPEPEKTEKMHRYGLKNPGPDVQFPEELLECETGVTVFFNSATGNEIVREATVLRSGLAKRGVGLSSRESNLIRAIVKTDSVSVAFVRRMMAEYGDESIRTAFLLDRDGAKSDLEFLLRKYKGKYYRQQYPAIHSVD